MRIIQVEIGVNGVVFLKNKTSYKGERNFTVLNCIVDALFGSYEKYLELSYNNTLHFIKIGDAGALNFSYEIPGEMTIYDELVCQLVYVNTSDKVVGKSDEFKIYFEDSIMSNTLVGTAVNDFRI